MADQPNGENGLVRRIGLADAVLIGLGSMIGAGVFAVFGPAARAAGAGLLVGLVLAAAIAYCNAAASAQLAAVYPTSGGTYVFGRERLGHWWGFTAGWTFLLGKTASCAAMALTVAYYALPVSGESAGWAQRLVAVASVLGLTALTYRGVRKTALLTRLFVAVALLALTVVVVTVGLRLGVEVVDPDRHVADGVGLGGGPGGVYGVLQAAGLLFFAFAGYARVATLGEEVRDPGRLIPRAILVALALTTGIYLLVAVAALGAAGPARLGASAAPLVTALDAVGADALAPTVRVGAGVASLGALLALLAGISRTALAMARNHDLPAWLAAIHPRHRVPHHAELALAVVVCGLVLVGGLREVIGFSSFGVLVYYGIANASAYTQPEGDRRWPRWLNAAGLIGCATLALTLPWPSVLGGTVLLAVGLLGRYAVLRRRAARDDSREGTNELS